MSQVAKTKVATLFLLLVAACSAPTETAQPSEKPDPLAKLDGSSIQEIEGNDGHNLLARSDRLERGMALAAAVKGVTGKKYCSPKRTLYRGRDKGMSYWTIECHDRSAYQVQIKKDGNGSVLDCTTLHSVTSQDECWQPFKQAK